MKPPVGKDPDQRNYIVSNAKIERAGYLPSFSLEDGIGDLIKGYTMIKNNKYGNVWFFSRLIRLVILTLILGLYLSINHSLDIFIVRPYEAGICLLTICIITITVKLKYKDPCNFDLTVLGKLAYSKCQNFTQSNLMHLCGRIIP